tara:strand:- start:1300 stop:1608 length:309 start_codon:yes stop_codon:yes gene_type:complete
VELTDNPEIMSALDDLIVGSFVMLDHFLTTLSRNSALQGTDYSTLLITVGLYATAYVDVRADSTNVEAHQHALQYVANHPISQKIATQATTAALDRITEVNE